MRLLKRLSQPLFTVGLLLLGLSMPDQLAVAQDLDAQLKWTEAKVIHYRLTGDYAGKAVLLAGWGLSKEADVTDHVEIEFDWDNQESQLIGKAVIRNSPTKLVPIEPPAGASSTCPPIRVDGAYEFSTFMSVTVVFPAMAFEVTQQRPGGAIPYDGNRAGGRCGDAWDQHEPAEQRSTMPFQLLPAMMLAMPGIPISKDGKSLIVKGEGWSWIITPSIVK